MHLSKQEQETILLFTEADQAAIISTYNARLIAALELFRQELPDACQLHSCTAEGKRTYYIDRDCCGLCFAPLVLDDLERIITA